MRWSAAVTWLLDTTVSTSTTAGRPRNEQRMGRCKPTPPDSHTASRFVAACHDGILKPIECNPCCFPPPSTLPTTCTLED